MGQTDSTTRDLNTIGASAYEAIVEMVTALNVDYDRLEELIDMDADDMTEDDRAEFSDLRAAAGDCASRDDAEQRIQEDPLSLEVRSGWVEVGQPLEAEEFMVLLTTGGPAVRIVGELDQYKEPSRAWLEVQDWGTPWTQYFDADQDVLLTYCRQFYFGE